MIRRRGLSVGLTVALALLAACTGGASGSHVRDRLQTDFARLATTIPATVGVAVVPVGGGSTVSFGSWSTGVAWSTIKVPLAVAALRADAPDAAPLAAQAITRSDNDAAEQLWARLGPPDRAARQVQAVLAEAGDHTTIVESRRLRPEFTAFGQTRWPLARQAVFAAHLPCLPDAARVVTLMRSLVGEQRWGLAGHGAAAKGGWGPGRTGGYLVRQFGLIETHTGRLGVALAAEPHDGSFETGVHALDQLARWLIAHAGEMPAGDCPG